MDKQQHFLANDIFDIDSALDRLEENLFTSSSDDKSAITEPVIQQQQHNIATKEENGNTTVSEGGVSEALSDNKSEFSGKFCCHQITI